MATSTATCSQLTGYGTIPLGTSTDFGNDGSYKVCVKLTDNANNPAAYGASGTFNLKTSQPSFLSLSLSGEASDGYINSTDRLLTGDLAGSIAGLNYDQATYKVVLSTVTCDVQLSYGPMPKSNSTDFGVDGTYKVCTKIIDNAANTPAYGSSPPFNLRTTSPTFTSLALAGAASDGYINAADRSLTTSLVGSLSALNYDSHTYSLVTDSTTCNAQVNYGNAPTADSTAFGSDGLYKICVKVVDNAQNPPAYGSSSSFTLKTSGPVFTSVSLANNAVGGYVNLAESSQNQDLISGLSATGYDLVEYKLVSASTTCAGVSPASYSQVVPKSSSADFTSNGNYKVCVKLTDNAGNPAVYNSSPEITLDKLPPSFTSIALSGDASNQYINASEKTLTTVLVGDPVGSEFDTASYKLVASNITCNNSLSYSSSKPQNNSGDFGADGPYKVCVKLSDAAGNTSAFGSSLTINLVTTLPQFYSVSIAAGDASNYYIKAAERSNTTALVSSLIAANYNTASYKLVADTVTCDSNLSYGAIPGSNSADFGSDGDYKVCVKVEDTAGNTPSYGESDTFTLKTSTPTFNSITLRNDAGDQSINLAERSHTTALAGTLNAFYYDSVGYKLVTSGTDCSLVTTYGSQIPASNSNDFQSDGTYKICVKVSDLAGNPDGYGESLYIALKTTSPAFTSLDLSSVITDDGYLNASDRSSGSNLIAVDTLVGTNYDTAAYKVVTSATTCDSNLQYSTAIPRTTNSALTTDTTYKVCVKLTDTASNPPAYGSTNQFTQKITPPSFSALPLANETADGYINAADYALGKAIVGTVTGANFNHAYYKIVTSTTSCDLNTAFNSNVPLSNSADFGIDKQYRVCVKLTDDAGNDPAIDYSPTFDLKRNAPIFTSIALANDAVGGYINTAKRSNSNNLVANLSASGHNATRYVAVLSDTLCSSVLLAYSTTIPKSNSTALSTDGLYKICVELTDTAANPATYGYSPTFWVDTTAPTVTLGSTAAANTKNTPIPVTVTFSETVTGFTSGDPTLTNGTLSNFNGSGSSYSFDVTPTSNGTVTVAVAAAVASDLAGNSNTAATSISRIYDTSAPSVSSVSTTTVSGNYGLGSTIAVTVTFSEAVNVTGTPTLTLNTSPTNRTASYSSGGGTSTLTFNYTVQAGDTSGRLDYTGTSALAGTIADLAGNAATLTLPATGSNGLYNTNIIVESNLPSPTAVIASQPNGAYTTGKTIDITVNYSDVMTVSGTPELALNTSPARSATYSSGSGSNKLLFQYTVQSGDTVGVLNYSATSSLTLNGGSIQDAHGTNASLTLPSTTGAEGTSLGHLSQISVDTTAATVTNVSSTLANATYGIGKGIPITVAFSEAVFVTGQPRIQLNVTPSTRYAVYTSGSGTGTLTFTYIVEGPNTASGDQAADLNYASTSALELNGGSINDEAGNSAALTLPGTTAAGSLGTNKNLVINSAQATSLTIEARTCCSTQRIYGNANELTITFPSSVSNYATVNIYSALGTTAPTSCTGTPAVTLASNSWSANSVLTVLDQSGSPGKTYSYRICAFNNGNSQVGVATSGSATTSTAQFAFVTSTTTTGNIGGVTAADTTCQTQGSNFDSTLTWVALLSYDTKEAAGRVPIVGPVYSTQTTPALIASGYRGLWHDDSLSQAISYNASGTQETGSAWSGSQSTGTRSSSNYCSNWNSASAGLNGTIGSVTATNGTWFSNGVSSCDNAQRFYCVSKVMQPLSSFSVATPGSGTGGDVSVTVTFPADTTNWTKAEVRRMLGSQAPTCSQGTVVKTYTSTFTSETFTDATGKPGALYQYSVCVYNGSNLAATYMRRGSPIRTYRATNSYIMFVTSLNYDGNLGGLSGSPSATDSLCQARGDLLVSGYTWRAVIGDSGDSAASRISVSSSTDVRNLNGDLVIAGSTGLFAGGDLTNAVSYDDSFAQTTARVWTGATSNGSNASDHCSQWGSSSSGTSGRYGSAGSVISTWLSNSTQTCDKQARLYCISTVAD